MSTSMSSATTSKSSGHRPSFQWRIIDIVTAAVLGVASGFVFWAYNGPGYAWYEVMNAFTPGFGGFAVGPWLFAGVLGGLVVRKPGAAIFVEVLAASVSAGLGNQWGIQTLYSGLAQGIGAELILALFLYRRFGPGAAALTGVGAGIGLWLNELFAYGNIEKSFAFNATYLVTACISGLIIAGIGSWLLTRALAQTGALDRFGAGRERTELV